MPNFLIRLSYDGAPFHGWQIQPGLRTLQGALSEALERVCGERATVHGSGRTDAGVHALAQVASVQLQTRLDATALARALNAVLPLAVRVLEARAAAPGFHARRDARGKIYGYRIYRERVCPPFLRDYAYHFPYPLDEAVLAAAAAAFCGEHDFRHFASGPPPPGGTRRTVFSCQAARRRDAPEELWIQIAGSGFLHHMVRRIGGFLLETGLGLRRPDQAAVWLDGAGEGVPARTLPARGLYLMRVLYAGDNPLAGAELPPAMPTARIVFTAEPLK